MIFISILTLIVAKALPSIYLNLSSSHFTRISAIIFIYAGVLSFNTFYIQSIGSGIGLYSGLFQITQISMFIEVFSFASNFRTFPAGCLEYLEWSASTNASVIELTATVALLSFVKEG